MTSDFDALRVLAAFARTAPGRLPSHVQDALARVPEDTPHPDDLAVDSFAAAMKAKLAEARAKGRRGWDDPDVDPEALARALIEHVFKGDPRDVANFCMFLHARADGRNALAEAATAFLKSASLTEREFAATIAEMAPLAPGTNVGRRQMWLKKFIAAQIRGEPLPEFHEEGEE